MKQLQATPLKRFHRDWKRAHPVRRDIVLVLNSVQYPANVGSLFRIADGAGLEKVFLCGLTPTPSNPTVAKVGRDKHNNVPWEYQEHAEEVIAALRDEGYCIYALELTDSARPYYEVEYPDRLCMVVGNEDHGVTRAVLAHCDESLFVPMYGKGLSLNVHVSAAIVLYHILHLA
jgi:23S rRNA (guanosine2251-2'-O)-methyltransferase